VLVTSAYAGARNIMTMGLADGDGVHAVAGRLRDLQRQPQLRDDPPEPRVRESIFRRPKLTDIVVGIGATTGAEIDKFGTLWPHRRDSVARRRSADRRMPRQFRVSAPRRRLGREVQLLHLRGREGACRRLTETPANPALHGDGVFMVSGKVISRRSQFGRKCSDKQRPETNTLGVVAEPEAALSLLASRSSWAR